MLRVLEDAVFEGRFKILESIRAHAGRATRRAELAIGRSKRYRERLGDPFGKFAGKVALSERRIVAGLETGDGRKRQLVVDTGVVDSKRCRKKAVADDFVGEASAARNERDGEPGQARAPKTNRHKDTPRDWVVNASERPMAAKFTSTSEVRAPARGIRLGKRTGRARVRAK